MTATGCRIGRIRLKTGAVVRVIPSADEQYSRKAFSALDRALGHTRRLYGDQLDGFAIAVWTKDGMFNTFRHTGRGLIGSNIMPTFVAEALRRDTMEMDTRNLLQEVLGND